ncbi:hypothetical protein BC831DRAFT_36688 [Entophlyctis helioformis]|nr:hypothetical protein BC831DRAFT_36688 [Entophlyctis helioformis]
MESRGKQDPNEQDRPVADADVELYDAPLIADSAQEEFLASDVRLLLGTRPRSLSARGIQRRPLLATGSADGTARIWDISAIENGSAAAPILLMHNGRAAGTAALLALLARVRPRTSRRWIGARMAVVWRQDLTMVWRASGIKTREIKFIMRKHVGPVFSLKWSKNGDLLLSGGVDKTAIIWDAKSGEAADSSLSSIRLQHSMSTGAMTRRLRLAQQTSQFMSVSLDLLSRSRSTLATRMR